MIPVHSHNILFEEIINSENISRFRGLLSEFRNNGFISGNEKIVFSQMGCNDNSCPVFETIIRVEDSGNIREIKIGRKIENITRLDIFLAMKKQFPEFLI